MVQSSVELWQKNLHQAKQARDLVFDYALGTSLITLLPIAGYYTLRLLLVLFLLVKMCRDIGKVWQFPRGQDLLAITGNIFGAIGAVITAAVVWGTLLAIGIWVPYFDSFKGFAGLFTLTWMLGQSTNQYYANGALRHRFHQPVQPDQESINHGHL